MAEHGMFQTTDLVPLLADRGIVLSREQVFRLVTQTPQRLSMDNSPRSATSSTAESKDLIEVQVAK